MKSLALYFLAAALLTCGLCQCNSNPPPQQTTTTTTTDSAYHTGK